MSNWSAGDGHRDVMFSCADTGTVVSLAHTVGSRPGLVWCAVFLPEGDALWAEGGGTLAVGADGALRLAVRARRRPGGSGSALGGTDVPISVELSFGSATPGLAVGAAGGVGLLQGGGSVAAGSAIRAVRGAAWASVEPGGRPLRRRARAVFQDGSALYATDDGGAALVRHAQIRGLAGGTFGAAPGLASTSGRAGAEGGEFPRALHWQGGRVSVAATIRDDYQRLTIPEHHGRDHRTYRSAPFVFVRAGVTGLGLVEEWDQGRPGPADQPDTGLPDPF